MLDALNSTFFGALRTVTLQSTYRPFCSTARMIALPAFTPVITPFASTCATDDLLVNTTKAEIVRLLTENLAPGITIHDFRMVPGSVRTKVLFDAVIPLDVHLSDQEIILKIKNIILKKRDDLDVAVTIDRPYA